MASVGLSIPVELSPGDVLDRLTILELKLAAMGQEPASVPVRVSSAGLHAAWRRAVGSEPSEAPEWDGLLRLNRTLWVLEDAVRDHESRLDFGSAFVASARAIYQTNDLRAQAKKEVDRRLGSSLGDVKLH